LWVALARTAECQYGVLAHAQLREAGLSKSAIARATAKGLLHRVFHGVYPLGHPGIGERGRVLAATLACGAGAVVSHRSAAALMGLLDMAPVAVDLITLGQRGRRIDGIRWHDVRPPRPWEVGTFDGIPCTSPARTLVDLAGEVSTRTLRSCFERAAARKLLDLGAVEATIGSGGRRGTRALRTLLDEWRPALPKGPRPRLKSPLEAMVLPLLALRGLPAPRCNSPVELAEGQRIEVDLLCRPNETEAVADAIALELNRRPV
jgi:Transcriptional regulator, AbiEi antitoxin